MPSRPSARRTMSLTSSRTLPFGREVSYQNCNPKDATTQDSIDLLQWMTQHRLLGLSLRRTQGHVRSRGRQDHATPSSRPFYAEYFDGNPSNLNRSPFIFAHGRAQRRRRLYAAIFRIQAACNGFDATQFDNGSASLLAAAHPTSPWVSSITPIRTTPGQAVIFNKGIAYAYLLAMLMKLALVQSGQGQPFLGVERSVRSQADDRQPLLDQPHVRVRQLPGPLGR